MKYVKCLLSTLIFFICLNVKAIDECTNEEMLRIKELANNVEIKYNIQITNEYNAENNDESSYVEGVFQIQILNNSEDLKYVVEYNGEEYELNINELNELTFEEGTKVIFNIYSYTTNMCTRKFLKTYTLNLPYYNQFYHFHKDECTKTPDFKYCKEFLNKNELKTLPEMEEEFKNYINDKSNNNNNFKSKYMIIIVSIIIAMGLGTGSFLIYKKNKKKNDDL